MKKYNKLVRDKIPKILDKNNISYKQRIVKGKEYQKELIKKLSEEISEFQNDSSVEELADVVEVILALKKLPKYKKVETVRKAKKEERGGFEKGYVLKGTKA